MHAVDLVDQAVQKRLGLAEGAGRGIQRRDHVVDDRRCLRDDDLLARNRACRLGARACKGPQPLADRRRHVTAQYFARGPPGSRGIGRRAQLGKQFLCLVALHGQLGDRPRRLGVGIRGILHRRGHERHGISRESHVAALQRRGGIGYRIHRAGCVVDGIAGGGKGRLGALRPPLCLLGLIGKPAYRRARVFELGLSLLDLCRGQGLRSIHALVGLLQGRVQRLGRLEAHRFDEGRIHGRIQGVCTGIGDLGRYRSDLLVHVVIDVGFLEMAGRKRQEFCREIRTE